MKNIYEILADYGMAVEEEKRGDFERALFASYKSVAEMEKKDGRIAQLEQSLLQQQEEHAQQLAQRDFSAMLRAAIASAGGRNEKAILALLDQETLKTAEDPAAEAEKAIDSLKKSDAYLFGSRQIPPLYAKGTGAYNGTQKKAPATLAGALQERFNKERK